jgi:dimethylargininase
MFKNAIVRIPGDNFAEGLTTANMGSPIVEEALKQHEKYCEALQQCSLTLTRLPADPRYPDSTFVEDTAVLTDRLAILARPGAISRRGEVESIKEALARFFRTLYSIILPGTVDGGDICEVEGHFFIGISKRTNVEGAQQLAGFLSREGYTHTFVDIRGIKGILHLKSGIAYLGDNRLVLVDTLAEMEVFKGYDIVRVAPSENYAANCVRVNDYVLIAAGFPGIEKDIRSFGYSAIALEMSEFQKMDGGLSCLSLRF